MRKCAALLMTIASTACASLVVVLGLAGCAGERPVIATVDTLCVVTTRYRASDAQVEAFKADRALWEPLVDWLASFNRERDRRCLQPGKGN